MGQVLELVEQGNMGKLLGDKYETSYVKAPRSWSPIDYTIWVDFCTSCYLGCADCHEWPPQEEEWLSAAQLDSRINAINGGQPSIVTVALGDPFLSPNLQDLLDYANLGGHHLVLYSYFPKVVSLLDVQDILKQFPNISISYSLHGLTDAYRETRFLNPHPIESILSLLANPCLGRGRHRIYSFEHLVTRENYSDWLWFYSKCRGDDISVVQQGYIDYKSSEIWLRSGVPMTGIRFVRPRKDFLELICGRKFTEVVKAPLGGGGR